MDRTSDTLMNLRGYYAGFVTRMVAFLVDLIIIVTAAIILGFIQELLLNFFGISALIETLPVSVRPTEPVRVTLWAFVLTVLVNVIILTVYQVFFLVVAGKTPGKALAGLRVVPEHGPKLTIGQAIVRTVGYFLSALPLFLGFLVVLVNEDRRAWHDRLANTYVLYDWDARLGSRLLQKLGIERPQPPPPSPSPTPRPRRARKIDTPRSSSS